MDQIFKEYNELLDQIKIDSVDMDYSIFDKQIPFLDQMCAVNNCGITVFDFSKKAHVYNSSNFNDLFGFDLNEMEIDGTNYFKSKIHPEDLKAVTENGVLLLRFYQSLAMADRKSYKLQNEYRVLNGENTYTRVIEQHQVLELDKKGNLWLALCVLDISPSQDNSNGIISQLINHKSGECQVIENVREKSNIELSKREKEILNFVKQGLLSKEISHSLSISVHTVNTHRQNILKKLSANNSFEAVEYATRLNLV